MCFTDYIGISRQDTCDSPTTPVSGLYMDQHPGIDLVTAGELAGQQYKNGRDLLEDCIANALIEVKAMARPYIQKHIKALPITTVDGAGQWSNSGTDADDYATSTAGDGGVEICLHQNRAINMSRIYITTIECLANTTIVGKTVTISDRNTTTTKTVTLAAGDVAEIDVYQQFNSDKVYVYWDRSDVDYNLSYLYADNCSSCGGSSWKGYRNFGEAYVRGKTVVAGTTETGKKETYGLRVNFEVVCDMDIMLCKIREQLKYIYWKECAKRYYEEALADPGRFNALKSTKQEEIKFAYNRIMVELYGDQEEAGLKIGNRSSKGLWNQFSENIAGPLSRFSHPCIKCRQPTVRTAAY